MKLFKVKGVFREWAVDFIGKARFLIAWQRIKK